MSPFRIAVAVFLVCYLGSALFNHDKLGGAGVFWVIVTAVLLGTDLAGVGA